MKVKHGLIVCLTNTSEESLSLSLFSIPMEASSAADSEKRAVFSFYNGYLGVVYGLVVTDGLHDVLAFTSGPNIENRWNSFSALLFLGSFLLALHFWYVCATVDDLSQHFYRILAGTVGSCFDLLLLFDALVATILAGMTLGMFQTVPQDDSKSNFFLWFLSAAALSLLYDLISHFLVSYARRKHKEGRERDVVQRYGQKVNNWIKADVLFGICAGAMYLSRREFSLPHSFVLGAVFAAFTVILLLMDVEILTRTKKAPL